MATRSRPSHTTQRKRPKKRGYFIPGRRDGGIPLRADPKASGRHLRL